MKCKKCPRESAGNNPSGLCDECYENRSMLDNLRAVLSCVSPDLASNESLRAQLVKVTEERDVAYAANHRANSLIGAQADELQRIIVKLQDSLTKAEGALEKIDRILDDDVPVTPVRQCNKIMEILKQHKGG